MLLSRDRIQVRHRELRNQQDLEHASYAVWTSDLTCISGGIFRQSTKICQAVASVHSTSRRTTLSLIFQQAMIERAKQKSYGESKMKNT